MCQGTREARWNGKGEVYRSWRLKRRDQGQRTEESKGDYRQGAWGPRDLQGQDGLLSEVSRHGIGRKRNTETHQDPGGASKAKKDERCCRALLTQPLLSATHWDTSKPPGTQAHRPAPKLLAQLLLPLQHRPATLAGSGQAR